MPQSMKLRNHSVTLIVAPFGPFVYELARAAVWASYNSAKL